MRLIAALLLLAADSSSPGGPPRGTVRGTARAECLVRIQEGLEGREFPAPEAPAVMRMRNSTFFPHVMGLRVGQEFVLIDEDPGLHALHIVADGVG